MLYILYEKIISYDLESLMNLLGISNVSEILQKLQKLSMLYVHMPALLSVSLMILNC